MKGDAVNLSRVLLVRLSVASAAVALTSVFVYVSGSIGSLSGGALSIAVTAAGLSGVAAVALAVAAIVPPGASLGI